MLFPIAGVLLNHWKCGSHKDARATRIRAHSPLSLSLLSHLVCHSAKELLDGITARALIQQYPEKFAVKGSRFWLVQPKIGITGASNLDTLLNGPYLEVKPGDGAVQYDFIALSGPVSPSQPDNGLNVVLSECKSVESVFDGC